MINRSKFRRVNGSPNALDIFTFEEIVDQNHTMTRSYNIHAYESGTNSTSKQSKVGFVTEHHIGLLLQTPVYTSMFMQVREECKRLVAWHKKPIMITTVVSTIFRPGLIPLKARASQWIMQCVQMHSGDFCFSSACILLNLPEIVRAQSVHIPTKIFHSIFASFIKLLKISNNAIAVALSFIGLQRSSSTADIPS
ncbi:hypothetical protein TNCV_1271041 [Trichonephila clavipes]|nr:hypothetical protein TNCV_1271041 [Trichonephila clavipes]